jgi:hypothetical protein
MQSPFHLIPSVASNPRGLGISYNPPKSAPGTSIDISVDIMCSATHQLTEIAQEKLALPMVPPSCGNFSPDFHLPAGIDHPATMGHVHLPVSLTRQPLGATVFLA